MRAAGLVQERTGRPVRGDGPAAGGSPAPGNPAATPAPGSGSRPPAQPSEHSLLEKV